MKFNCPKCRKPFSLSSERLAGQVLKIRCSSCGTVFKVRGRSKPAPKETAPGARQEPQPVAKPPAPEENWFAVVGRKRVGPFGRPALKNLIDKGKVKKKTLLWRSGMDNWLPAGEIESLAELFAATGAPGAAPAPPPLPRKPSAAAEPAPDQESATAAAAPEPKPAAVEIKAPVDLASHAARKAAEAAKRLEESAQGEEADSDWGADAQELERDEATAEKFFAVGEEPGPAREMAEIEIGEPEIEPLVFEEERVQKGAKETLRDFSVMARLSSRSRRKKVAIMMTLGGVFIVALGAVFYFSDPLNITGKQQEIVWEQNDEDFDIFANAAPEKTQQPGRKERRQQPGKNEVDPLSLALDLDMDLSDDEAKLDELLMDEGAVKVDKALLKERIEAGQVVTRKRVRRTGPKVESPGIVWGEDSQNVDEDSGLAGLVGKNSKKPLSLSNVGTGSREKANKVVDRVEVGSGGGFLGNSVFEEKKVTAKIAERKVESNLWKVRVRNNVVRKVRAERRRLQRCAEMNGAQSGVKVILHLTQAGQVKKITSNQGGAGFPNCVQAIFSGWQGGNSLPGPIKVPVRLRFE